MDANPDACFLLAGLGWKNGNPFAWVLAISPELLDMPEADMQVKKMSEHDNFVNSCCPLKRGPPLLVSGSDDATAKVRQSLDDCFVTFNAPAPATGGVGDLSC